MKYSDLTTEEITARIRAAEAEIEELYRARRGRLFRQEGAPDEPGWVCLGYCIGCGRSTVDVSAGDDTCRTCLGVR